jgi:hypothetical protein
VSRTRPVVTPALLALSALALLTGCAAGNGAQTLQPYSPADGVVANSGDIRVLNALVVADATGTTGVVSLTIVNRSSTRNDSLTNLTSTDGSVDLTGTRDLPSGRAVRFGATTEPSATISDLKRKAGQEITLTLSFARTEPLTVHTLVLPAKGAYADITPGPATPVETTDTPTDTSTASATDTSTASPTPTN